MRRKHAFVPTTLDRLESRVVLSRTPLGTPVVVSGLYPHQRILNLQHQSGAAEINQVFGSFQNDYDQARATYFTSIQNQPIPARRRPTPSWCTRRSGSLCSGSRSSTSSCRRSMGSRSPAF